MTAQGRYRHHRRHRFDPLPAGVRLVTRISRWGNRHLFDVDCPRCPDVVHDRAEAIAHYRADIETAAALVDLLAPSAGDPAAAWLAPLADAAGLACCRLDLDCHADVLIELLDRYYPRTSS